MRSADDFQSFVEWLGSIADAAPMLPLLPASPAPELAPDEPREAAAEELLLWEEEEEGALNLNDIL